MNANRPLSVFIAILACGIFALSSCDSGTAPTESGGTHSGHGAHGGEIVELGGEVAHLEVLHDQKAGTVTIYVTGPDTKTILVPDAAPLIKLVTDAGPKVITLSMKLGETGVFTTTDALLQVEPVGRIEITIGGVRYQPDIPAGHGH